MITQQVDPAITLFATRLRLARDARKWSARDLAARSGVSAASVCRAELGQTDMMLGVAARLAAAVGLPLGEMLAPSPCARCDGTPPAGFTCNECGRKGGDS